MHPAPSIILFTTISGLGFGFLAWLGLFGWGAAETARLWVLALLGGGLAAGGLSLSLGHLGHPERAWMALSQWRTSWLSREGVVAVVCLALFAAWAGLRLFFGIDVPALGWLVAAFALATVFTTSMIYTQLKTVPRWNHFGTPVLFLAAAVASGSVLYAALVRPGMLPLALVLIGGLVAVQMAWRALAAARPLSLAGTPESATGLGALGRVRLFEKPHTGQNYLLKEMVHKIGRKHAVRLERLSLVLMGPVSGAVVIVAALSPAKWLGLLALVALVAGTLCARWLFFAQAEHAVGLYYGRR